MSLSTATLLPGLLFLVLGVLLLIPSTLTVSLIRGFPRSRTAAALFFGGGALWFLWVLHGLGEADLIFMEKPLPLMIFFGAVAVLSFHYVPDFLAVRGVAVLILLGAWPLLTAALGEYDQPQRLFMVAPVYVAVALAIYLGASPFRMRDFLQWLFQRPARARLSGALLAAYGLLLGAVAITY